MVESADGLLALFSWWLRRKAYALYERFRPEIPTGKNGWGAKGK